MSSAEALAKRVLLAKDRYALLSLGSTVPISLGNDGFLNLEDEDIRKAYMKLAVRIHPDKLKGFPDATRAFQALVRAYELCCKPDLRADDDSEDSLDDGVDSDAEGGDCSASDDDHDENNSESESDGEDEASEDSATKAPSRGRSTLIAMQRKPAGRSTPIAMQRRPAKAVAKPAAKLSKISKPNESPQSRRRSAKRAPSRGGNPAKGAARKLRTCVKCPRCYAEWGDHLKSEYNEAAYTEFMQGKRQVHCLTCLFEFGCLTASHHCPACKRSFEYRPQRFRRTATCPNDKQIGVRKKCGISFGFAVYARSKTKKTESEAALKQAEEQRQRGELAANARRARAAERTELFDDYNEELGAFIVSEDCPRCGKQFSSDHAAHLRACKGKKGNASKGKAAVKATPSKKRKKCGDAWMIDSSDEDDRPYKPATKHPIPPKKGRSKTEALSKAETTSKAKSARKKVAPKPRKLKPETVNRTKQRSESSDERSDVDFNSEDSFSDADSSNFESDSD